MKEGIVLEADDRLLKIGACLKIIPVAQSTWWVGIKDGRFPKPVKIGGNTFWRYSDIMKVVQGG
jgi:prophage regulatory protein